MTKPNYFRKIDGLGALDAVRIRQISEYIHAELVKLLAEKLVHYKKLHDRVYEIGQLDKKVSGHYVVAQVDARAAEQRLAKIFYLIEDGVDGSTATRIACILVYVLHDVFHDFGSLVKFLDRFVRVSRLNKITHVQAGTCGQ